MLYYIILYYIILYYIILCYIILYYIILFLFIYLYLILFYVLIFVKIPKVQYGSYDNCFNSIVEQGICYFTDFSYIIVFRVF